MEKQVYLIYDGRHYKIGQSNDPVKRFRQIKVGNPSVKLMAYGYGLSEKFLHVKYKKYRVSGEWFKLDKRQSEQIIREINSGEQTIKDTKEMIENYVFCFGKYEGKSLTNMVTPADIRYLKWCIRDTKLPNKVKFMFKYWINDYDL